MRVPVFPSDLIPNCGFKLIAKVLKQKWPAPIPIGLMKSQEVLSQGLGYHDFHDLAQETVKSVAPALAPPLAQALDGIGSAISAHLRLLHPDERFDSKVKAVITSLPLIELQSYRDFRETNPTPQRALSAPDPDRRPLRNPTPRRGLDRSEIIAVWQAVEESGNTRDRLLLGLMLTGMRASEIVKIKVGHPSSRQVSLGYVERKGREESIPVLVPESLDEVVEAYVAVNKCRPGEYLFPSQQNQKMPMSYGALFKRVSQWAIDAPVPPFTPHSVRQSVVALMGFYHIPDDSMVGFTELMHRNPPSKDGTSEK